MDPIQELHFPKEAVPLNCHSSPRRSPAPSLKVRTGVQEKWSRSILAAKPLSPSPSIRTKRVSLSDPKRQVAWIWRRRGVNPFFTGVYIMIALAAPVGIV